MNTFVYGLSVHSNVPLPWCVESMKGKPDLSIRMGIGESNAQSNLWRDAALWYSSPFLDAAGSPAARIHRSADDRFRLAYSDGSTFILRRNGREVSGSWDDPRQEQSAIAYLLGPVLGWVLRLRGITCLHASALAVAGKALLLVGTEGAGKSTTAAALLRAGHGVLTDDVAPLVERDGSLWVNPGIPRLLLGEESVNALWGNQAETAPLFPGSDKGYVDRSLPSFRFCDHPVPLGAIYFLERRDPSLSRPRFEPVTGAPGLMRLVANTFANRVPDQAMTARDFEVLGKLINHYPVRSVTARDGLDSLDCLRDALVADFLSATCR